ncbi:MAG: hypothetical protein ACE5LU_21000 [Anaerolineae bacterium]
MQQRISDSRYSMAESGGKSLLVVGLVVLTLLAVPWFHLPYGKMDWVALGQPYETSTPATTTPATPTFTATATSEATATPILTPVPPTGNDKLTARVYIDYQCEGSFQHGFDKPLGNVSVKLSFSDGTSQTRQTTSLGMVYFAGIDLSGGATVKITLPEKYRGHFLNPCSPTTVHLPPGDLGREHIMHKHVEFRVHPSVNPWPFGTNQSMSTSTEKAAPPQLLLNQGSVGEDINEQIGTSLSLTQATVETEALTAPEPTYTPYPTYTSTPTKAITLREAIPAQAPPALNPLTTPTFSQQISTPSQVTVGAGIGVSRAAIQTLLKRMDKAFELEPVYYVGSGQPRATGALEDGSVLVELVGPPDNLVSASMTVRMPSDSPSTVDKSPEYMLALLQSVAPTWKEGHAWFTTNLSVAAEQGEVKTTHGGLQIVLQRIEEFGVTALTVEGMPRSK